jgi:hypothetical protein
MKASLSAAIFLMLVAAGCASTPAGPDGGAASGGSLGRLRTGMTAGEARAAAGEPVSIEEQDCTTRQTVWRYADGGVAILRDGRIAFHYP